MATKINKPLTRQATITDIQGRRIKIILRVDADGLAFRAPGSRRWLPAPWATLLDRLKVGEGFTEPARHYGQSFADVLNEKSNKR